MVLYRQGEVKAFMGLYERYERPVCRYLQKRVGSFASDEVAQDAFMKLHQNRHLFDLSYRFRPWFFTLVYHAMIDYLRRTRRVEKREQGIDQQALESFAPEEQSSLSLSTDGDASDDQSAIIKDAMSELSDQDRSLMNMRIHQELSYQEIAAALGLNESSVRKRLSRAIERLRRILS